MTDPRYRTRIRASKAHIEAEVEAVAKKLAHHGPEDLKEVIRQRMNVHITDAWARELCLANGWKEPKA